MAGQSQVSRAAVLRHFGEPLRIEDVLVPATIVPGALLVEMDTCTICGTDVHLWQGDLSLKVDLPVIVGHEMVGRVVAIGDGADRDSAGQELKKGDRIVWTHTACNSCFYCTVARQPTMCENRRAYMFENIERPPYLLGGFSEMGYVLPESARFRVPDAVSSPLASLCSCAFRSVMNALDNLGPVSPHETVVIQGAGPLGLLATAVAHVSGCRRVLVVGDPEGRLALAREFGADETLSVESSGADDRLRAVRALTDGRGADVVMEFTGNPTAFNEGLDLVRPGGRYLVVGQLGSQVTSMAPSQVVKKNLRVMGSFSGDARSYWKALSFAERWQSRIPFEAMLTNRYALQDVNDALAGMKNLTEIKPVITFN